MAPGLLLVDGRRITMTGAAPPRLAAFPLQQTRVCLDCDCITLEQSCPWCDRDGTVPLAGWFRPMEERKADASRQGKRDAPAARRWILIVQHHQRELYRVLRQALAGTGVEVLYERRVGQRRRVAAGRPAGERRGPDRRRPRPSAIVYQDTAVSKPESPTRPRVEREVTEVVRPRHRQATTI
jgi:hypothetical protein